MVWQLLDGVMGANEHSRAGVFYSHWSEKGLFPERVPIINVEGACGTGIHGVSWCMERYIEWPM